MRAELVLAESEEFRGEPLLERVRKACKRLARHGWEAVFRAHGLDIGAKDLKSELLRPLTTIDRRIPGFHDFSLEGSRGIEPGRPAQSLLYHAFASPQVTQAPDGSPLRKFPTLAEIEAVENLVYGISPPSIQELRVRVGNAPLAIAVFASEYRPAINSVHQRHADVCFSRAGVARVGTAPSQYLPDARGYLPFVEGDPHAIRVLPCRYAAYIAARLPGASKPKRFGFGPLRFQAGPQGDTERNFWVPIHKLFSGPECLRGLNLEVTLKARHVNEKLRRVHRVLAGQGLNTGSHEPDLSKPPFTFRDGLADLSRDPDDGLGLLVPAVHPRLVEQARYNGKILAYNVPENRRPFRSSLNIDPHRAGARSAPEYVHARHRLEADGTITNLNDKPDIVEIITAGNYRAVHYIDFTADGSIEAECPELALELPQTLAAYSIVAPVDYFPLVKQQELMQWWEQSVPPELEKNIWPSNPGPPLTLCDTRLPANLSLTLEKLDIENSPRPVFDPDDDTMSAIVGLVGSARGRLTQVDDLINARVSTLPDGAAGIFAPGWDVSIDRADETEQEDGSVRPGTAYFNNYGLGSPFPEDAMLCAALSSFWPAAAPDVTRTFAPAIYATATPLTDDLLGQTGGEPWDGIPGPRIPDPTVNQVEYRALEYGDYVQSALDRKFNIDKIARTTAAEYAARTLVMARVYTALEAVTREQKREWVLFSFTQALPGDADRRQAEAQSGTRLSPAFTYRFKIFKRKAIEQNPRDHRSLLVSFDKMLSFFADPQIVLRKNDDGTWTVFRY